MKHSNIILLTYTISLLILVTCLGIYFFKYGVKATEVKSYFPISLLKAPIKIEGNKSYLVNTIHISSNALKGKDAIQLNYNLHGLCLLAGDASSLELHSNTIFNQKISLNQYGKNCFNGEQKITIPLADFPGYSTDEQITDIVITFWYPTTFSIDMRHITAINAVLGASTYHYRWKKWHPTPTPKPTVTPTLTSVISISPTSTPFPIHSTPIVVSSSPTPLIHPSPTITPALTAPHPSWNIQSVSSMKVTKDKICNVPDQTYIGNWVDKAVELGANYISIEQPYDSPLCGDAVANTKIWVSIIRSRRLHVWHRHMPLAFEGIYNTNKNPHINYIQLITQYISANPTLFQAGDIFTPIPEPQNGGIQSVTYCPQSICMFNNIAEFNTWLRDAMTQSELAFQSIGLGGKMKIGYYGFDGFVTWGDNNPDWHGILEDATIQQMGNITIDHYPEVVGDTMDNDLNELHAKYPQTPIIIGEWGTITGGDTQTQVQNSMGAALQHKQVVGFNYWHLGPGGNEALINSDFTNSKQFTNIKSFYISIR